MSQQGPGNCRALHHHLETLLLEPPFGVDRICTQLICVSPFKAYLGYQSPPVPFQGGGDCGPLRTVSPPAVLLGVA